MDMDFYKRLMTAIRRGATFKSEIFFKLVSVPLLPFPAIRIAQPARA